MTRKESQKGFIMADEKTPEKEPNKETQNEDSWEKRYKDSQAHITKIEQENATLRDTSTKDKELFETIQPYINWDAVNGTQQTTEDDDGYVDKKTLTSTINDLREQINRNNITQSFRVKYPDMVQYEDLVGVYLGKTDPRRNPEERIASAVESVKKLIESERAKGRESLETEKKEKTAKQAEASGLSGGKTPEGEDKEPEGENFEDYMKFRRSLQENKTWKPDKSYAKG
jgi:hypothetical protein